ncbi:hypothetical protein Syun_000792 [Stephania yunnanensis]|uniref:Uncharacterized protein n=1 Tax=Stephania yunnanensis TaxID=152371 RepID=A0AAP0Q5N4_9MAGN
MKLFILCSHCCCRSTVVAKSRRTTTTTIITEHHHLHHRHLVGSRFQSEECFTDEVTNPSGVMHVVSDLKNDDLQIAKETALRDIFGSSDNGSSSYENLGYENNTISLADEITNELLTAYQDHAKEKGFAVTIRSNGKVLAGRSVVDEFMLIGESFPVFKEKGLTASTETVNWICYVLEETLQPLGAFAEYESKSYEKLVSSIEIIQARWCK